MPEITDIKKIKGSRGKDSWTVVTDKGSRAFEVEDRHENVVLTDNGAVLITDTGSCRYKISDYRKMGEKARSILERVLL